MSCVRLFVILFAWLIPAESCTPVKAISAMYSVNAKTVGFRNDEKTVQFIPMHHIGKAEFYENVRVLVKAFKEKGYIVYYESSKADNFEDSSLQDLYERKFRKMMGFYLDSTGYSRYFEKSPFKNMVDQPQYSSLGVTGQDTRVDVPKNKLVDVYEEKFGRISLDTIDYKTPFNAPYPAKSRLPKDRAQSIIIDHRNQNLATYIHYSPDLHIVVLYGAIHVNGTFSELRKFDEGWKKK
ncbi:MAG TPA: hypothetical protein VFD56_10585 [Chitinophagaceae bacterium]|nr:hypothetical protein [Chitinophagaceae bacterium]